MEKPNPDSDGAVVVMVKVHYLTTKLFSKISGLNKRSLASKYLHFHVPELFYIFDSRAYDAMRNSELLSAKLAHQPGPAIRSTATSLQNARW